MSETNNNARDLALRLNCRQYREEITKEEIQEAKEKGLIVIFGASDDLVEIEGAVSEELGALDGGKFAFVLPGGKVFNEDESRYEKVDELSAFSYEESEPVNSVEAVWCPEDKNGASWAYETKIPHNTFNIFEGDELYCIGIVIDVANLN